MTAPEREARILSLEPLVKIIAKKKAADLPSFVHVEDLISAGWIGAIKAVDRFDPARDVRLIDYAKWRIHGEIGDYLRSIDPLSRDHRKLVKQDEETRPATFSIDQKLPDYDVEGAHEVIPDARALSEQRRHEARLCLAAIYRRAHLRPRTSNVLKLYFEGETMKVIGHSIGVNESRVSQMCSRAIRKLRAAA